MQRKPTFTHDWLSDQHEAMFDRASLDRAYPLPSYVDDSTRHLDRLSAHAEHESNSNSFSYRLAIATLTMSQLILFAGLAYSIIKHSGL